MEKFAFNFPCIRSQNDRLNESIDYISTNVISDECMKESYSSTSVNNTDDIYKQVKTYLSTKQQLKQLECVLKKESQQMHADNEEIKRLADDIRKQAKAALIT